MNQCDRVVVRDGGFDCCGPVDDDKVLLEITDPNKLDELMKNIEVQKYHTFRGCGCCGYPGVDWYKGNERLALTSIQHGHSIRWKGFKGDAYLTEDSSAWIIHWLKKHGIKKR
jgi:hypothetical protein